MSRHILNKFLWCVATRPRVRCRRKDTDADRTVLVTQPHKANPRRYFEYTVIVSIVTQRLKKTNKQTKGQVSIGSGTNGPFIRYICVINCPLMPQHVPERRSDANTLTRAAVHASRHIEPVGLEVRSGKLITSPNHSAHYLCVCVFSHHYRAAMLRSR